MPLTANYLIKSLIALLHAVTKIVSGNQQETIKFFVPPSIPIVLDLSWLKLHNPYVDWSVRSIISWSVFSLGLIHLIFLSCWCWGFFLCGEKKARPCIDYRGLNVV